MGTLRPAQRHRDETTGVVIPLSPRRVRPPALDAPAAAAKRLPSARSLQLAELLSASFWCETRNRRVCLETCIDDFVTHSAQPLPGSCCAGCSRGAKHRRLLAGQPATLRDGERAGPRDDARRRDRGAAAKTEGPLGARSE